jgi:hypothetical protein
MKRAHRLRDDGPTVVYALRHPLTRLVKFGITRNLKRRISTLSSGAGARLILLAAETTSTRLAAQRAEAFLLMDFPWRRRWYGEWFRLEHEDARQVWKLVRGAVRAGESMGDPHPADTPAGRLLDACSAIFTSAVGDVVAREIAAGHPFAAAMAAQVKAARARDEA